MELNAWLDKLTEMYSIGLSEPIVLDETDRALYAEALSDLTAAQLDSACLKACQTCRFFPRPADIRMHVDQANGAAIEIQAEESWQRYLVWVRDWYYPDLGVKRGVPPLDAIVDRAARAAGGHRFVEMCSHNELVWAKKRFVGEYTLIQETRQVECLLSDGEAKQILSNLSAGPETPATRPLPPANHNTTERPGRAQVRHTLDCVTAPPPKNEVGELESRSRKDRQARAIKEYRMTLGLPPEPTPEELRAAEEVGKAPSQKTFSWLIRTPRVGRASRE